MLEVGTSHAFSFLRAEEGNRCLGRDSSIHRNLPSSDEHKAVTFRFPSEIDDGIFDGVNYFNRHTLLSDSEYLEVRRK